MPAPPTTRNRLVTALEQARDARHHSDCRCFMFRDGFGEAFCTREEATWNAMVDRILTTICRESEPVRG